MKNLYEELTEQIISLAEEVHKELGPGLLENVYRHCLAYELSRENINFQMELNSPVIYKNVQILCAYKLDLLIDNKIIVELKTVDKLTAMHEEQVLAYMKLNNKKTGLLINFNEKVLRDGIKTFTL